MRPSAGVLRKFAYPAPQPAPSGEAFALVRRMLQERPRHFREILADGIALSATGDENPKPVAYKMKKMKGKAKAEVEPIAVPEGHPFVSATFLKKRILPVLESQQLIKKAWLDAEPGSSMAKASHHEKKHAMWVVQEAPTLAPRWERMTSPELEPRTMMEVGAEARVSREAYAAKLKAGAMKRGQVERTERDIMAWAGRPAGITTSLERKHLSVRRARRRTFKEELAVERINERKVAQQAAEEAVKAVEPPKAEA